MKITGRLTLWEVCQRIEEILMDGLPESYWVVAEISDLKVNRTGHCYLELVEKSDAGGQPKAKVRATIWAGNFRILRPFFETATGRRLSAGLKVLVLCSVSYHPVYGLSLNIRDIDPNFTLGDIEQKRKETIQRLIDEGVFEMNKQIELPLLPKRVAIISSPTAAGYEDFTNQLDSNPYGYIIQHKLFTATVQGDKAEESIVNALDRIHEEFDTWDIVAIIRGGGSQTDLSCFDGYTLGSNIAQFPLPIITGIGHEKDTTVADMVCHTRLKTPTAAAEFIIGAFINAESLLMDIKDDFIGSVETIIERQKHFIAKTQGVAIPTSLKIINTNRIELQRKASRCLEISNRVLAQTSNKLINTAQVTKSLLNLRVSTQGHLIRNLEAEISKVPIRYIEQQTEKLLHFEKNINSLKPENIIKRGFSITFLNGKVVKSADDVKLGDRIESVLKNGKISSKVISKE